MPKPLIFSAPNRLAKVIGGPDAQTQEQLIERAQANVTALGDTFRTYIREQVAVLLQFASQTEDILFAEAKKLGDASLGIAEIAGAANMEAIGEVARGVSAMIAGLATGVWHSDALLVHLRSLALVSQEGPPTQQDVVILERLAIMRQRIGVVE